MHPILLAVASYAPAAAHVAVLTALVLAFTERRRRTTGSTLLIATLLLSGGLYPAAATAVAPPAEVAETTVSVEFLEHLAAAGLPGCVVSSVEDATVTCGNISVSVQP